MKNDPSQELKQLLQTSSTTTQTELQQLLQQKGVCITQSQVSRLLRKIGAVKMINEQGQSVYALPYDIVPPSSQSSLAQLIVDIVANETLIVIHTNPGSAPLIARLFDHQLKEFEILGTVAGDDTLFVVPTSIHNIQEVLEKIKHHFGFF